jgi:uncharacterized protein (TIGR04222 family)
MNPFDLPGPVFLAFYAVFFLGAVAVAAWLRRSLRRPDDDPPPEALDLAPYEVAYLQGKERLAVDAAIARLVHEDVLAVDSQNRRLQDRGEELPAGASELEEAVYRTVRGGSQTIAAVRPAVSLSLAPVRRRLQDLGLLVADDQAGKARFLPTLVVLLVVLVGVVKIFVGLERHRPVTFLVGCCILSAFVAFGVFARAVHRSRRGDQALAQLKEANAALESQAARRLDQFAGDDLVLALGLFGLGILAGSPLAELHVALQPPPSSGSSSCGSSSCGGGCGGGGCGGCGG